MRKPTLEDVARLILPRVAEGGFFSPFERNAIAAAAEPLLEGCPVKITPEEVVRNLEEFLLLGRGRRAWRIRILATLVELSPLLLSARKRFSRLTPAERKQVMIDKFMDGHYLWSICSKIKQIVYLGVYSDPRAEEAVGFLRWYERPRYQEDGARVAKAPKKPARKPATPRPPRAPRPSSPEVVL